MISCPCANAGTSDRSIRCTELKDKKWDFCIHQYFCREKGKYLLNNDAANCKLKREKEVK